MMSKSKKKSVGKKIVKRLEKFADDLEKKSEGEYTNIRIEAQLTGETDEDTDEPIAEFILCYTNLKGQSERMKLDATDQSNAIFEAAGHVEKPESFFSEKDETIIWS